MCVIQGWPSTTQMKLETYRENVKYAVLDAATTYRKKGHKPSDTNMRDNRVPNTDATETQPLLGGDSRGRSPDPSKLNNYHSTSFNAPVNKKIGYRQV